MGALNDLLQGTSKGFWAGGAGAPVDTLTLALNALIAGGGYAGHKMGLLNTPPGLIEKPVGGSEWIAEKMRGGGLLNDNPGSTADNFGNVIGGLLGPVTAAKAPQIARGLLQMEANAAIPQKLNRQTGAIVWHGSPHKFDRFDSSRIGTGEGNQSYGHGLYLAESPGVAKNYLPSLSNDEAATKIMESMAMSGRGTYGLRVLPESQNIGDVLNPSMRWVNGNVTNKPLRGVSVAAIKNGDVLSALSNLGISKPGKNGYYFGNEVALVKGENAKAGQDIGEWTLQNAKVIDKFLKRGRGADPLLGGDLYKVDLPDEHIAKMLDWDKPLSEQAPEVQKALSGIEGNFGEIPDFNLRKWMDADPLASTWHNVLQRDMGADPAMITKTLKDRGIPGIRYLDGGSRGTGQGTSNFVIFPQNEGLLKILERNGKPIK